MKNQIKKMLVLLLVILSLSVVSFAQEPTVTNSDSNVFGLTSETVFAGFAFIAILINGLLTRNFFQGYQEALGRKDVRDNLERQYMQSSVAIQDLIKLIEAGVTFSSNLNLPLLDEYLDEASGFIRDVTDGKENLEK